MSYSQIIKAIRKESLLSQEAFAKELGVSFTTVNRWESGKCRPTYRTMKLIDKFCKDHGIEFDATAFLSSIESEDNA
jgi:putative transcriptional regulator